MRVATLQPTHLFAQSVTHSLIYWLPSLVFSSVLAHTFSYPVTDQPSSSSTTASYYATHQSECWHFIYEFFFSFFCRLKFIVPQNSLKLNNLRSKIYSNNKAKSTTLKAVINLLIISITS